jgi:hypothetical protein
MGCIGCGSAAVSDRSERTAQGYRRFGYEAPASAAASVTRRAAGEEMAAFQTV